MTSTIARDLDYGTLIPLESLGSVRVLISFALRYSDIWQPGWYLASLAIISHHQRMVCLSIQYRQ